MQPEETKCTHKYPCRLNASFMKPSIIEIVRIMFGLFETLVVNVLKVLLMILNKHLRRSSDFVCIHWTPITDLLQILRYRTSSPADFHTLGGYWYNVFWLITDIFIDNRNYWRLGASYCLWVMILTRTQYTKIFLSLQKASEFFWRLP